MNKNHDNNHRDEFDNSSLNHYTEKDEVSRPSSNGFSGFVKNPYVFFTAIFASIGGILFGCKSFLFLFYIHFLI